MFPKQRMKRKTRFKFLWQKFHQRVKVLKLRHKTQQAKLIRMFRLNYTLICYFKNTVLNSYNMGLVI